MDRVFVKKKPKQQNKTKPHKTPGSFHRVTPAWGLEYLKQDDWMLSRHWQESLLQKSFTMASSAGLGETHMELMI